MSAGARDKTQEEKRKDRFLSVIYFVDANKTRSFRISISRLKWLAFVVCLLFCWSFWSAYLSYDSYAEKDVLRERLHGALATIFEYQSRYDGVYESAYPKSKQSSPVEAIAGGDEIREEIDLTKDSEDEDTGAGEFLADNMDSRSYNMALSDQTKLESNGSDWPIAIEDLSLHNEGTELSLSFAIRNVQSPSRSEGFIWALAVLVDSSGKKNYLASPSDLEVDAEGNVMDVAKKANSYSIRYYKVKSFYFAIPKGLNAKIEEINIGMMDKSGSRNVFKVPLASASKGKAGSFNPESTQEATPESIKVNSQNGKMARKVQTP